MAFRYTLRLKDGCDVGEVELARPAAVGDEIGINGERQVRVFAVIAATGASSSSGRAIGFLVVEPVDE
jgi:hypothetical protein